MTVATVSWYWYAGLLLPVIASRTLWHWSSCVLFVITLCTPRHWSFCVQCVMKIVTLSVPWCLSPCVVTLSMPQCLLSCVPLTVVCVHMRHVFCTWYGCPCGLPTLLLLTPHQLELVIRIWCNAKEEWHYPEERRVKTHLGQEKKAQMQTGGRVITRWLATWAMSKVRQG